MLFRSLQISKSLYNQIPNTDVRKGWWLGGDLKSKNLSASQQAMVTGYGYKAYTQVKFAPYNNVLETSINANDIPLMRVEEMYLIKAEAEAMSGQDGKKTLEDLLRNIVMKAMSLATLIFRKKYSCNVVLNFGVRG